jgi:hypothetical protein
MISVSVLLVDLPVFLGTYRPQGWCQLRCERQILRQDRARQ